MSKMVKLFKEHCVLLLSIGLMVSGFIYLFYQMITVVIENVNQTTCFLLFKKITYGLIKYSNITEYKYIDVIICYFEIFLIYVVMRELVAIVFGIIHLVKQKQNHGMAVAGIVTAVVGILAFVTYWLLIIHAAGRTSGPDEFLRRYEYQFDGEMKAPDDYQDLEDYLQHNFENF